MLSMTEVVSLVSRCIFVPLPRALFSPAPAAHPLTERMAPIDADIINELHIYVGLPSLHGFGYATGPRFPSCDSVHMGLHLSIDLTWRWPSGLSPSAQVNPVGHTLRKPGITTNSPHPPSDHNPSLHFRRDSA
jgi:hypothetical protein